MAPRITDQIAWDAKKQEILDAALRVFAARGLVGTRITDIASAAGVSTALLYHYFKDKEAVFSELVSLAFSVSIGSFKLACSLDASPAVRLHFLLDSIFSYAYKGDGPLFFLLMVQAGTFNPIPVAVQELQDTFASMYGQLIMPVIEAGQTDGEIRSGNAYELFGLIIAMIQGYAVITCDRSMKISPPPTEMLANAFLTVKGWEQVQKWQLSDGPRIAFAQFLQKQVQ